MAKVQKLFACTSCGTTSPKWAGRCPGCNEWNTFVEEVQVKETPKEAQQIWRKQGAKTEKPKPVALPDIKKGNTERLVAKDEELNRVLGGGIVPGSLVLIGGEPGIGKSTLLLQLVQESPIKTLYVSGEESEEQIRMRADRIGPANPGCFILTETNISHILTHAGQLQPDLLIIDSIQTLNSPHLDSPPGSISQIRECTGELQRFAKETNVPVFVIGHINKEGNIAGPKLLEHIVDTVLQFEGDRHHSYRLLRTIKNRFGSTAELGIYEMQSTGLREVSNPSELLLSQHEEDLSGSAVISTMEGLRPMLIEAQALVTAAVYGTPQRSATGYDMRRLSMLLAVLEKRCGFPLGQHDVFLNLAGGLKVADPAADLGIVSALLSSFEDIPVSGKVCFAGEVGLSGEIRAVSRIEQRIQEAGRLGFDQIFISKYNMKGLDLEKYEISVFPLGKIEEVFAHLFT